MANPKKTEKISPLVKGLMIVGVLMVLTFIMNNYEKFPTAQSLIGGRESDQGQAQGSLQMAVDKCRSQAKAQLGSRLLKTDLDELSTRYNDSTKQYLVFIDLVIKGEESQKYFYECQVSAVNQKIIKALLTSPPGQFQKINLN